MSNVGHRLVIALAQVAAFSGITCVANAQSLSANIEWEVANRFRLFKNEGDFVAHVNAARTPGGTFKSILGTERTLSEAADVRGWAAGIVSRLCYKLPEGRILDDCVRDGFKERYLNSKDERVKLTIRLSTPTPGAQCFWTIGSGAASKTFEKGCDTPIDERFKNNVPTQVRVLVRSQGGQSTETITTVQIRDVLLAGMGDSIASGEGNPVVPIDLSDKGFCYRRLGTGEEFFLPGRAKANVTPSCPLPGEHPNELDDWNAAAATWLFNACHRSLYSYQTRAALMLAIENKNITVTYIPLGCTGATIKVGILGSQRARERPKTGQKPAPRDVEAQISQLTNYLRKGNTSTLFRKPDAILLTIGANDIGFSELVANAVITENPERNLLTRIKLIRTPDFAREQLRKNLGRDFTELRKALISLTDKSLSRVVYTTYGNPAVSGGGKPCGGGRVGFDAHPAFSVDEDAVRETVNFVENEFVPSLRSLATCEPAGRCGNPATETMTYADAHRAAFANHGFCALQEQPEFDRKCFLDGNSFQGPEHGLETPLTCKVSARSYSPYAQRSRWVRTVNDSFFAAMTYPSMGTFLTPSDIHDGLWGLVSVVYGGAIHPTAEGHAAMADSTIISARKVLGLPAPPSVIAGQ